MKRVLVVASIYSHITAFHMDFLRELKAQGYIVDIAGKNNLDENSRFKVDDIDNKYEIEFSRNPFSINNIKAYLKIKKILKKNKYDFIYCHTPSASVMTRLAALETRRTNSTKVIYMAHGFHFFKGAKFFNWIFYYSLEKILSKYTDLIITMNSEDYKLASKKFTKSKVIFIDGVGINFDKFKNSNPSDDFHKNLNIDQKTFVITSIGELSKRKNQDFAIKNLVKIIKKNPNIKYLIVGEGKKRKSYEKLIRHKKMESNIRLLGYRKDISNILGITDLFISTSKQEGLPINIIEASFMDRIILASDIRGHIDIIDHEKNGFLYRVGDNKDFISKVEYIFHNYDKLSNVKIAAGENSKKYDVTKINSKMSTIFSEIGEKIEIVNNKKP